jgi:ribosomal protein S17
VGGPRIKIDEAKFVATVHELESKNTYRNMFELQKAVANSSYGMELGINPPNVYQYIRKYKIQLKTKAGKVGDSLLAVRLAPTIRMSKAEQWKNNPEATEWLAAMRQEIEGTCRDIEPDGSIKVNKNKLNRFRKILTKAENGSVKALIAANCIQCCAGETVEIRECGCISCPFFMMRPWKGHDSEFSELEVDDVVND